jgi:hypothetical protein
MLWVAVAGLYIEAHQAVQSELLERSPHLRMVRRPLPLDAVWRRFDAFCEVLVQLVRHLSGSLETLETVEVA